MRWARSLCGVVAMVASVAAAGPENSIRPDPRATTTAAMFVAPDVPGLSQSFRPQARVSGPDAARLSPMIAGVVLARGITGPTLSIRPDNRPANLHKAMSRRVRNAGGGICNDPSIQGEAIAPIKGRIRGCGVQEAVRVRAVSGVTLTQPATIDCPTARALRTWVDKGARPAVGNQGGGIKSLRVVAHYACRTRNNQKGARISEHGKGRAVDIAAVNLQDGTQISVLRDWGKGRKGTALKKMHRAACGPFGTVLGPNSDRFHRDHFHFDTARYRSGAYCR